MTIKKKYIVELTTEEREQLNNTVKTGKISAHKRQHAQMLLKVDQGPEGPGWSDIRVAEALDCRRETIERLRQRFVERGFENILQHGNKGRYQARKLDGCAEAHLIALTRSEAPQGYDRWTVRLLASQMVILEYVDSCSKSTVHDTLKKMNLSLT